MIGGDSYRPVIFPMNETQLELSQLSLLNAADELSVSKKDISVQIENFTSFWEAEEYHQDFSKKNTLKYNFYRYSCGRDERLQKIWGKNAGQGSNWENTEAN